MINALIFADEAAFQSSNGLLNMFSTTNGTGLPILDSSLTAITQALQIPVIILLIAFLVFAVYTLGKLLSEYFSRKKVPVSLIKEMIYEDNEEDKIAQNINKTDIVTRIGPTLGLMGTLIPMGPGLAALGTGDVTTLASAITIAFNTTVIGIGSGAIAYFASKIRRRWFGEYLANLDALMDAILDNIDKRDERLK